MLTSSKIIIPILVDILRSHGVKDVVCSPGSRDIPLLIGFKAEEDVKCRMVIDERSAAFIALGLAQSTGKPVALVCTSGTAVLNYAPAVAEAFYQGLPLIVISADRPEEWIDQDDSQTIKQPGVMANFVKKSYDLADTDVDRKDGIEYCNRVINDAMLTAIGGRRGPVHINLRLSPPLGNLSNRNDLPKARIIERINPCNSVNRAVIKRLAAEAVDKRILVVAGFMPPDARLNKGVNRLYAHRNVVIMAETISNLHLPAECYAIDTMLCEASMVTPQIVISIGGAIVSRMLKEYLRTIPQSKRPRHWCVGHNHTTVDCFQSLTTDIQCNPADFIGLLSAEMAHILRKSCEIKQPDYREPVDRQRRESIQRMTRMVNDAGWSEAFAIHRVLESVPRHVNLSISNGTCIRYAQILSHKTPHAEYCNRGVSGIEGSTSTAVGIALASEAKDDTVSWLLTGDMSLTHDLGGLAAAKHLDVNIHIIVISNGGGGIFRFIDASRNLEIREEMLCVDANQDLRGISEAFGFEYLEATDRISLAKALNIMTDKISSETSDVVSDSVSLSTTPPSRFALRPRRVLLNIKADGIKGADLLRKLLNR